mmetsp:Transcript_10170/g.11269  ORF Transcript_10170/g.11269 Transcript_10170/m.11269 type:complete len:756 (+) Transcript_10170:67-2334(+)
MLLLLLLGLFHILINNAAFATSSTLTPEGSVGRHTRSRHNLLFKRTNYAFNIRGGSSMSSIATTDRNIISKKKYARVGLIDLLNFDKDITPQVQATESLKDKNLVVSTTLEETTTSSVLVDLVTQWIYTNLVQTDATDFGIGTILAIPPLSNQSQLSPPSSSSSSVIQGTFSHSQTIDTTSTTTLNQNEIGNIVETIGCISNSVIILYDVNYENRQSVIVRLLKGIQRQNRSQKSIPSSSSSSGNNVNIIFLANSDNAVMELNAIKDVLIDDDDISNEMIEIIPLSLSSYGDKEALQEFVETMIEDNVDCIHDDKLVDGIVPIDALNKLVNTLHARLSGKKVKSRIDFVCQTLKNIEKEEEEEKYDDLEQENDLQEEEKPYKDVEEEEPNKDVEEETDEDLEKEGLEEEDRGKDQEEPIVAEEEEIEEDFLAVEEEEEEQSTNEVVEDEIQSRNSDNESIDFDIQKPTEIANRNILEATLIQESKSIIEQSEQLMTELEMKQDQVLLEPETKMPILQFGKEAGNIIENVATAFDKQEIIELVNDTSDFEIMKAKREELLSIVNSGVYRLFETQLQSIREYYGRRYESVLNTLQEENNSNMDEMDEEKIKIRREKHNTILTGAAKRSTEGFRVAAENAIPSILKKDHFKEQGSKYTFETVLDGLIKDMMHATSSTQLLEDEWVSVNALDNGENEVEEDSDSSKTSRKRRGPVKWYEKLAARALVISVNYLQGWLAWQGVKKAAADRDKSMPKFPLF